ncbi:MAG: tryptophan synthase subunit alpha [Desulfobulbaceae bacterium]|jgi:tryptophan synthase alpha chain|nr:tryptophan synthase subunit alpha [Desulfobulbaceae bacterium]
MKLRAEIEKRRTAGRILLMTHIVLGYPSFAVNRQVIAQMVENGVDCIEMQIPFSEPMADGPIIAKACQASLASGCAVADCLAFGAEMAATHGIPFLYMTYANIIFKYGYPLFFAEARAAGIQGVIVPDMPPEMDDGFFAAAKENGVAPVLIFAPTSTDARMKELARHAEGFVYCAARRGVTGRKSSMDDQVLAYLRRCRATTELPLAVGFGIQTKDDIDALTGVADMAVIGSKTIQLVDSAGAAAVGPFIAQLRG